MKKDKITNELYERGLIWLSEEYRNLDSLIKLQCSEKHEFFESVRNTRKKSWRCPICVTDDIGTTKVGEKLHPRVLGLDNATDKCGFSIVENGKPIVYGTYKAKKGEAVDRIAEVKQWFTALCNMHDVDAVGFEDVYYSGNPKTLITLSMLLGALCVDAHERNHPFYRLSASEWRSIVGLKPSSRTRDSYKRAAQQMVKVRFGLDTSQDTAEAILISLATEKKYNIERTRQNGFGVTKG